MVGRLLGVTIHTISTELRTGICSGRDWHLLALMHGRRGREAAAGRVSAAWTNAIIAASGAAAEALGDPRAGRAGLVRRASAHDRLDSAQVFREMGVDNPGGEWRFRTARRAAREFLQHEGVWRAVETLEQAVLDAGGELGGDDATEVIEGSVKRGNAVGSFLIARIKVLTRREERLRRYRASDL